MRGFTFVDSQLKYPPKDNARLGMHTDKLQNENFSIYRKTVSKFLSDKVFFDSLEFTVVLEGMLLNDLSLIEKYKEKSLESTIIKMYKALGEPFFKEFRGSFSGILIDKKKGVQLFFTNHIGDQPVYYFKDSSVCIVATQVSSIVSVLSLNKINHQLNEIGAYCMLTHGYMLGDFTLVKEIKKIPPGSYLRIKNGKKQLINYFTFSNIQQTRANEEEVIEQLDHLFLNSVSAVATKNKAHGFSNVVPLSAGLDTRMVNFALKRLGVEEVVNFTYSQSNHVDETIPKRIATDLKRKWLFKPLDDGLSIIGNIDQMIEINDGMVLYYGPGQVWDSLRLLDENSLGIINSGMLGDFVVNTSFNDTQSKNFSLKEGANSVMLLPKLKQLLPGSFLTSYSNIEQFKLYNRCFNGANFGAPVTSLQRTVSYSPFCDVDVMTYCLSLPVKYRLHNYIYDRWILQKYPDAARYLHNGVRKIGQQPYVFKGKPYYFTSFTSTLKSVFRKIGLAPKILHTKNHMNPLDYWYVSIPEVKNYMDNYFLDHIDKVSSNEMKQDCTRLYNEGNTIEKTQVLTLLGAINKFFNQ